MPERGSSAAAVLEALGFAIFVRDHSGALRLEGTGPNWLRAIWPELKTQGAPLPVEKASPFLENFLVDASECWEAGGEARSRSGPWIEQTDNGTEVTLEAVALNAGDQAILLLERLGEVFEAKKSMLQKARETVIAYQRLESEMQKKEILLSCIADEMNAALANTITSLRLMELEQDPQRIRQLLVLASRATEEQQSLINKVLHVFADELEELYGHNGSGQAQAKLDDALTAAKENVGSLFADKRVRLNLSQGEACKTVVSMDRDHLGRVLTNLFENALQNSTAGGEVELAVVEESESVLIKVLDNGAAFSRDLYRNLFSKTGAIDASPQQLKFCRVAVENCRGEIGGEPRAEGGNCFWIRLPKPAK
jgi:signal transduction histidine kinase